MKTANINRMKCFAKCTILAQLEFDGNNVKKKSWDRAMFATV